MTEHESALVLVQPSDTVAIVAAKARRAGTEQVELLIPADNADLQIRRNMAALRQILAQDGVGLLVVSSDDRVLNAARLSGVDTLFVEGVRVAGPLIPRKPRAMPQIRQIVPSSGTVSPVATNPDDLDMLDLLDQVADQNATPAYQGDQAELYASLDDLSDTFQSNELASRRVVGDHRTNQTSAGKETLPIEVGATASRKPSASPRPEDRPRSGARRANLREEPAAPIASRRRLAPVRDEDEETPLPRRQTTPMPMLIIGLLVAILLIVAVIWALSSRVTVIVHTPSASIREVPITDEVLPVTDKPVADTPAILAVPVSAETEFTVSGQVANQTISPTGNAQGTMTIINTIDQALNLPEGTEFIGKNDKGAEVRFAAQAAVTIPGASTSSSLTGRSTTYGQAQVVIIARSPGAASNVVENTIKQILIPGQPLLDCGTSNFICQHGPMNGGTDELQYVVTNADVQAVLGEALTGLYNAGIQQLRSQGVVGQSMVDETSIAPNPQALGRPESYDQPVVTPPIGQVSGTREFKVTVRTRFTALAVPPESAMKDQIAKIVNAHFAQRNTPPCSSTEVTRPSIQSWNWDGASLKVNGTVVCEPVGALAPETRLQVRDALRGKTRDQAEVVLRDLQSKGVIGEYTLPQGIQQFPPLDALLDVQFVETPKP
jgi:hypothetical protein